MHAEAVKACETTGVPLHLVSIGPGPLPDGTRPFGELFGASPLDEPGGVPRAIGSHTQNWWICVGRAIGAKSTPSRAKSAMRA